MKTPRDDGAVRLNALQKTLAVTVATCMFSGCATEKSLTNETKTLDTKPETSVSAGSKLKAKRSIVGRTEITPATIKSLFPADDLPTGITIDGLPSGKVKDPFAKDEPKNIVQPEAAKVSPPIKKFGPCGDESFSLENRPELVTSFHYDFEPDQPAPWWGFQGWTVDGTYKLPYPIEFDVNNDEFYVENDYYADNNSARLPSSFNNEQGYGIEGAINFDILNVSHLSIDSRWVYTDFVSPEFTEADQSWRNINKFEFIMQERVNGVYLTIDGELAPYPGGSKFLAQLLIDVEECDGTKTLLWQLRNSEREPLQAVFCQIDYQTQCSVEINLSDMAIRKIKQFRVRVFQHKDYEYELDNEAELPTPVIGLLDFKGIQ